jgi:hypothetical protein
MNDRKVFGVLVRIPGLLFALWSMEWLASIPFMFSNNFVPQPGQSWSAMQYMFAGAWRLALGIVLLRYADSIVRFSYRDDGGGVRCQSCGYDLRATPDRCPECGTVPPKPQNPI